MKRERESHTGTKRKIQTEKRMRKVSGLNRNVIQMKEQEERDVNVSKK